MKIDLKMSSVSFFLRVLKSESATLPIPILAVEDTNISENGNWTKFVRRQVTAESIFSTSMPQAARTPSAHYKVFSSGSVHDKFHVETVNQLITGVDLLVWGRTSN